MATTTLSTNGQASMQLESLSKPTCATPRAGALSIESIVLYAGLYMVYLTETVVYRLDIGFIFVCYVYDII